MIVYGKNNVRAYLTKNIPNVVFLDHKFSDQHFINFIEQKQIRIEYKPKDYLNEITNNGVHQGVVIITKEFTYSTIEELCKSLPSSGKVFILDQLTDPHNLGAIIRSCNGAGIDAVIISDRNQVKVNEVVAKVSSGAVWDTKIVLVKNINHCILYMKAEGFTIVGTSGGANLNYTEIPKKNKIAIVMGSEGSGIRSLVAKNCDILVRIPMHGIVSSLNVSVASGILAYEIIKK